MTASTPDALAAVLAGCVSDRAQVRTDELSLRAAAHDASHVRLVPQALVSPRDADEVGRLLRETAAAGVPLTFRSGGTSLSGQAGGDGVLADVRRHFQRIEVLSEGARVRVQPGVTVRRVNASLARHGRKLGPDPASEVAATIGGVVANNSSGMACGTVENSYRTLESLVVVLPSGTVVDTGAADADERLRTLEPVLYAGLHELRRRVLDNPSSVATIARQFAMKNTMGYGINALVDFETAPQMLARLVVGSEGTLAFVASATFRTVPVRPHAATALLVFDDLASANRSLPALVATGAATLELMDATSLRAGQGLADCPPAVAALTVRGQAALLVEYQATTADELSHLVGSARRAVGQAELSTDPAVRRDLWKLRKGLYASVAGARRSGTTALLEDVVVPVERLADTCDSLTTLFDRYAYEDAVIFGHAKDGNLHFMLTDRFETSEQLARYSGFTEDLVSLVLDNGGSLKAEHGTGRVMAPFVARQYGDELYDVMRAVKRLFDPSGLLNPGVLLSDDSDAHLRHIKLAPQVEAEVDRCVECGYCEPVCPSRDLTLTPRQRIVLRREIRSLEVAGDAASAERLELAYEYPGVDTCAVDGMCGTACPVGINTGLLVKTLRKENLPVATKAVWTAAAKHWGATTSLAASALTLAGAVPFAPAVTAAGRVALGADTVPQWTPDLPRGGAPRRRPVPRSTPDAVYLPACVNVMFGPAEGPGVQVAFEDLCAAAGLSLLVPDGIDSLCCGTPWSSKGLVAGHEAMRALVLPVVREATDGGRRPIVCDASSCTEGFRHLLGDELQVVDVVAFVAERVLPVLGPYQRLSSVAVHPTCSSTQLGLDPALLTVAEAVADTVTVPLDWGCCAFAGDRGMLHPELTAAATRREAAEVVRLDAQAHASCNRTCELGMTRATGATYRHVVELLAEQALARPGSAPPRPHHPAKEQR
ncbi:FAD-binding and (Fe-S)-binding domain-containing protein [Cellulomonas sp. URHD0024]|uniref:FAD-binding and (Fe-S)-binding domain-containing protein n=1 Tax=Cellulomonas sp. URHD0024 TaxID=1302620 RepID=UPI000426C032|nr:FAD-binding and (Fe-S)-binding domain-containing protein [Cellulomonas sp. URHD0024]